MKKNLLRHTDEKRAVDRIIIGPSHDFNAIIKCPVGTVQCVIEDFHFGGVKVILPRDFRKPPEDVQCLELRYGNKVLSIIDNPLVIRKSAYSLTFGFTSSTEARGIRSRNRLQVKPEFSPILLGKDPVKISSVLNLKLVNFSSTGILAETSLSNKHLVVGMFLNEFSLVLPGISVLSVNLEIKHIYKLEKKIRIGFALVRTQSADLEMLAQFAIFGTLPHTDGRIQSKYSDVKLSIGPIAHLGSAVRIETVSTPRDYMTVLQIRYEAYKAVNKILDDATVESMADEFDDRSILIIAKIDGAIVATVRMVGCENSQQQFPFESILPFNILGAKADKCDFFEVSRLAIDPKFQGTDILVKMFKEVARQTIINGKTTICLSTRALRRKYIQIGFKTISSEVPHPVLKNEYLALLKVDSKDFIEGRGMSVMAWDRVVKEVANNLAFGEVVPLPSPKLSRFFRRHLEKLILGISKNFKYRKKKYTKNSTT